MTDRGNAGDQARCFEALKLWSKSAHIIFGDRDEIFTPEWGRAGAALIPGATFDTLPGPHHVPEESGPAIASLRLHHLGEVAPRGR